MKPSIDPATRTGALDAVAHRVAETLAETGEAFPYVCDDDGDEWETTPDGNWCAGHWIGLLWFAADRTADPVAAERFETAARRHTATMRETMPRDSMFCGMSFRYAGFRGYDASGDRTLFGLGLEGADAMRAAYHDGARQIPLGTLAVRGPEQFRGPASEHGPPGDRIGAVDNVYTALPVLWRAYEETGDPGFRDVAVSHADRHLDWYVREDGRTWHHAVFDDEGSLVRQYNELAYSDEGCWARGQGWSIAGLAEAYRYTGQERYLRALEANVDYYRANTDEGLVPYWDFEAPTDATTPRDTSAAVLAGYGLSRLPATDGRTRALAAFGRRVLASLVESYLVTDPDDERYGRLRHGCFNAPGDYATDAEHVWSDYYLAYALTALDADGMDGKRDGSREGANEPGRRRTGRGRTGRGRTGRRRERVERGHR